MTKYPSLPSGNFNGNSLMITQYEKMNLWSFTFFSSIKLIRQIHIQFIPDSLNIRKVGMLLVYLMDWRLNVLPSI